MFIWEVYKLSVYLSNKKNGLHFLSFSELDIADRRNKREVRHLEQELPKWQVLVDSVTGKSYLFFFDVKHEKPNPGFTYYFDCSNQAIFLWVRLQS